MKSLVKDFSIIGVVVLMLLAGGAFAGNNPPKIKAESHFAYSIYAIQKSFKFRLAFENPDAERVNVAIYDQSGKKIFGENMSNTNLKRDYNLSELGTGSYTIKLKVGEFESSRQIELGKKPEKIAFKSYISPKLNEKQGFQVAYENNGESVYVTITDQNGVILYSEQTEGDSYFSKRFNLSELKSGNYTVSLTCGDKTIERSFSK